MFLDAEQAGSSGQVFGNSIVVSITMTVDAALLGDDGEDERMVVNSRPVTRHRLAKVSNNDV